MPRPVRRSGNRGFGPLHDAVGVQRVVVSTYQSVSGTGQSAVDELADQAHAMLHEMEPPAPQVYVQEWTDDRRVLAVTAWTATVT